MTTLREDMEALQDKHLGARPTQAQLSEYFNGCLNSACGAVEYHSKGGNRAVAACIEAWRLLIAERVALESAKARGTA